MENTPTQDSPSRGEPDLAAQLRARALDSIADLLDSMFDAADQALYALSDAPENRLDRDIYLDTMQALVHKRQQITQVFVEQVSRVMSQGHSDERMAGGAPTAMPSSSTDEPLALARMVSNSKRLLHEDMNRLRARLLTFADSFPNTIAVSGLSPNAISGSFEEALISANVAAEMRLVIYSLFERFVLRELKATYQLLDNLLKNNNVEPKPLVTTSESSTLERSQGYGEHWVHRMQQLRQKIAPENQFGTDEILNALEQFDFVQDLAATDPNLFVQRLLLSLRSRQADSIPRSLTQQDQATLGMVAALFKSLFITPDLPVSNQQWLVLLRVPVMKIALIDPALFRDCDHPARRLVNEIATLHVTVLGDDVPFQRRVRSQIDHVANTFAQDPSVLEKVANELQSLSAELCTADSTERERKARLERAKRIALLEVRQQALGRVLPAAIEPFLLKAWGPVLAYNYLNHGLDSWQWRHAGQLLTRLLDAVSPPVTAIDRDALEQEQEILLGLIRKDLRALSTGQARIAQMLESLEATFKQVLDNTAAAPEGGEKNSFIEQTSLASEEAVFDDDGRHDASSSAFDTALSKPGSPE